MNRSPLAFMGVGLLDSGVGFGGKRGSLPRTGERPFAAAASPNEAEDGGGGGGVGRIRSNSPSPSLSGVLSPALSTTAATTGRGGVWLLGAGWAIMLAEVEEGWRTETTIKPHPSL